MDCNWKVAYDNFLEIYHVAVVHPNTVARFLEPRSFTVRLLAKGHGRFTTRKRDGSSVFGQDASMSEGLGDFFKSYTVALPRFPNGFTALDPAGFNWMNFWPVAPNKTVMACTLMGRPLEDPQEDRAYYEQFAQNNLAPLNEDKFLFPTVQRSMESGDLKGALLSYQEQFLYWYEEELDRRIGRDNIPPALQVAPLLERFVQS